MLMLHSIISKLLTLLVISPPPFLKNLIEDRRITHAGRFNNSRNLVALNAGDIFMARPVIQSDFF